MKNALAGLLLAAGLALPAIALASPCTEKTATGEAQVDNGDTEAAKATLEQAVAACRQEKAGTARPFIALGKLHYNDKDFRAAIPLFEEALSQEPGLQLAYMNLGASHMELAEYDEAIEILKKGLQQKQQSAAWTMKLNYNLGLAYFKRAAANGDETDTSAEPYFRKASELDPSFGGSFFYLGVLAEVMHKDREAALRNYKQGCDLGDESACQYLNSIDQRMAAGGGSDGAPPANSNAPLSASNEALMKKVIATYQKMGMDKDSIDAVVGSLRGACAQAGEAGCKAMLENTASALQ